MGVHLLWRARNRFARNPIGAVANYIRQASARADIALQELFEVVASSLLRSPSPVSGAAQVDVQEVPLMVISSTLYLLKGTVTLTIASPCVGTITAHGFANGQIVRLQTTGALPSGLAVGIDYFLVNVAANTMQFSATLGGVAIATTGTQSGTHTLIYKV
jgi:hypothetical protein